MANDCIQSIAQHVSLTPAVGVKPGKANHLSRLNRNAARIFARLACNSAIPHQLEQDQASCLDNGVYVMLSFPIVKAVLKSVAMQCDWQRALQGARIKDLNTIMINSPC